MHPDPGMSQPFHECMPAEARCVYCAIRVVYQCHGCGHFLSAPEMHAEEWRCEACA